MRLMRVTMLLGVAVALFLVFTLDSRCISRQDARKPSMDDASRETIEEDFLVEVNMDPEISDDSQDASKSSTEDASRKTIEEDFLIEMTMDPEISADILVDDVSPHATTYKDDRRISSNRLILPIYLRGGGPNWQYNNFKAAVRLSLYYERSIVAVPFVAHRSRHSANNLRDFQETFDVGELGKLLPVVPIEAFNNHCHGKVAAILTPSSIFPPFIEMYETHYRGCADLFKSTWNITFPDFSTIPTTEEARRRHFNEIDVFDCVAIFHPINVFGLEVPDGLEYTPWVDIPDGDHIASLTYKHLQRTKYVKELTDIVLKSVCPGSRFMAIHWRNKTGERCSLAGAENKECAKLSTALTNITNTIMVDGIAKEAQQNDIDCIYIARPSYSNNIEEVLGPRFKHIYTSDNIGIDEDPRLSILKEDNYVLSLVEQEICARSTLFGSTWLSSWSKFVVEERLANDKDVFYFYKFPGLTEEISLYF